MRFAILALIFSVMTGGLPSARNPPAPVVSVPVVIAPLEVPDLEPVPIPATANPKLLVRGDDPLLFGFVRNRKANYGPMPATCDGGANSTALQNCINSAALGDTITVNAGQTYTSGGFGFPDKGAGTSFITVTTNGTIPPTLSTYPTSYNSGVYTRMTTALAADMPKLKVNVDQAVLNFTNNAHHWLIKGLELTNATAGAATIQLLVGGGTGLHHITFEQNWVHPMEETGAMSNYTYRSVNHAFVFNGDNIIWRKNAIQGFTGHSLGCGGGPGACFKLEASSILSIELTNTLIEDNLLDVNGQLFIGGGGGINPAHTATGSSWSLTSATLSATTDLAIGDVFAVCSAGVRDNHLTPQGANYQVDVESYTSRVGCWANGRILTVNTGTGAITFTTLTSGLRYRGFNVYRYAATGGSYTLTWMGQTTSTIAWNADKATIRAALEALSNVAPGDFRIRNNTTDGWPYADFYIEFEKGEDGTPGAWAYPTAINPLTITSSLTGGNDPAFVGNAFSESYTPVENSQDGTSWADTPLTGSVVNWEGTQAHDVIVRRNILSKHHEWTAVTGDVKGFAEQKGCNNCTWDANIFAGRSSGFVFTVRNQGGSNPWASNSYTNLTNNLFEECGGAFDMANTDGAYELQEASHDILINNNICLDPGGFTDEAHHWMILRGGYNITITHNTSFVSQYIISGVSYIPTTGGTIIKDNIFRWQSYAVPCTDGVDPCWPSSTVSNNLLYNQKAAPSDGWFSTFGGGTAWEESSNAQVKFVALSATLDGAGDSKLTIGDGSNYTLDPTSRYAAGGDRDASDNKDVGWIKSEMVAAMGFDPFTGGAAPGVTICKWSTSPPCASQ